jgi:hypothetical protein
VILVGFFAFKPLQAFWFWLKDRESRHPLSASAAEPPIPQRQVLTRM